MNPQASRHLLPSDSASLQHNSLHIVAPPRVLAFDSDLDILMLYQESLGEDGFTVDVATDPLPLDAIQGMRLDLILLECRLARVDDGCVMLGQVRRDPTLGQIPCVVCTGLSRHAHGMADTLAAWDVPVLSKPFDLDELCQTVHAGLDGAPLTPVSATVRRTHR